VKPGISEILDTKMNGLTLIVEVTADNVSDFTPRLEIIGQFRST
jgi:hypothetical protein